MSHGKILVVRGGAIGDFVLTLPVFGALRGQFPKARLEVLGYAHAAALAQAGGLVDAVRSIEARALAGFFAKDGALDEDLRDYFAGFAVVISYLYDPDGVFEANVARCSKAQFIAGPHRPNDRAGIHATEVFLKPLERLAVFAPDATPCLRLSTEQSELSVRHSKANSLAVHPGSGSERKNWPEKKWAETLAQMLREERSKCLLIGGEAEGERVLRLASALPRKQTEVLQNLPLVEVARRLVHCDLFVGHDSGISHLAAAIGLPAIILWGDSVEAVWRPKGGRVVLIKSEGGLEAIAPAQLLAAIEEVQSMERNRRV